MDARIAIFAVLVLALAAPARAEDPAYITVGAGIFDVFDDDTAGDFGLEYRADRLWLINPKAGIEFTTDGAVYAYGGFNIDLHLGPNLVISPGTAVGAFSEGDGKDLGSVVEFRSGVELAYQFKNRVRIGVGLHHISNAGIGDDNPGAEVLNFTYSIPFGHVFQPGGQSARR